MYIYSESASLWVRESVSPRIRSPQNTLGPPIQSNDHATIILRQADVQVLLLVVVPQIINFLHASPPQPSTAVHAYVCTYDVSHVIS